MTWARRSRPRSRSRRAVLLGLAIATGLGAVDAYASGFNLSVSPSKVAVFDNNSVSITPTIPAGTRTTAAWSFIDASGTSATTPSPCTTYPDYCAAFFNDGSFDSTSSWPGSTPAFNTNYLSFAMNTPLPTGAGVNVASVSFNFAYQMSSTSDTEACYYLVTETASGATTTINGNVTAPLSSSSGWLGCNTSSAGWSSSPGLVSTSPAVTTTNGYDQVPLSGLSSTGDVNGLTVFVYEEIFKVTSGHATGDSKPSKVDLATVSGTMVANASSTPFTLYPASYTDAAGGTPATTPWQLAAGIDSAYYPTASTWSTGLFSTARYLQFGFPSYVPATATVTGVTLHLRYSGDGASEAACFIMDVTDGQGTKTTLGTSSAPAGCVSYSGPQVFTTTNIDLFTAHALLTTPAKLNGASFKLYWGTCNLSQFNGTTCTALTKHATEHDLVTLDVTYNIP